MNRAFILFASACVCSLVMVSAHSESIEWDRLDLTGSFRMEPKLELCDQAEISCDEPVYEGEISVHAKRSEEGRLTSFEVRIDGKLLPLDLVERYSSIDMFRVSDLKVTYPSRYVPEDVFVIGGQGPGIHLFGLSFVDKECTSLIRHVDIGYDLRREEIDVGDWCDIP